MTGRALRKEGRKGGRKEKVFRWISSRGQASDRKLRSVCYLRQRQESKLGRRGNWDHYWMPGNFHPSSKQYFQPVPNQSERGFIKEYGTKIEHCQNYRLVPHFPWESVFLKWFCGDFVAIFLDSQPSQCLPYVTQLFLICHTTLVQSGPPLLKLEDMKDGSRSSLWRSLL